MRPRSSTAPRAVDPAICQRLELLEHRLAAMSRSTTRWRRTGAAAFAVLAILALTAQAPGEPVERSFVVRDARGVARAQLGMSEGTPALTLYDAEGHLRAALAVADEGPILNFFGPAGTPRIVVGERSETAFLILRDAAGAPRAAMAIQEDGEPSIYLLDDKLTPLWRKP